MWLNKLNFKDPVLYITIILMVLELWIHYAGYDHLIRIGVYVTHHLAEMPSFLFFGMWLGRSLILREGSEKAQKIVFGLYFTWLTVYSRLNLIRFIAGNMIQWPMIVGFYSVYLIRRGKNAYPKISKSL